MKTSKHKVQSVKKVKHAGSAPALSSALAEALVRFVEYHPARRVTRNLRRMVFEFLMCEGAIEALYLKDLLYDLDGLFDLLDVIDEGGEG